MAQAPAAIFKIPTDSPQPAPRRAAKSPGRPRKAPSTGQSPALAGGTGRVATVAIGQPDAAVAALSVSAAGSPGLPQDRGTRLPAPAPATPGRPPSELGA
jgi:hypothetical protein